MKKTLLAVLVAMSFVACGDDDDSTPDARILPIDARPQPDSGSPDAAANCTMAASVTVPATGNQGTYYCASGTSQVACTGTTPANTYFAGAEARFNSDTLPDILSIQLYSGSGVVIGPGSYNLGAAPNTNYSSCMQCLVGFANYDQSTGPAAKYFQTAGTMVIGTITAGTGPGAGTTPASMPITFTGVTIQHANILEANPWTSTLINDGCITTIADGSVTVEFVEECGVVGYLCCTGNACNEGTCNTTSGECE